MYMQVLIFFILIIIGLPVFSQNEQFPHVNFEVKAATFNCELASMVAGELSSYSKKEIHTLIENAEHVIQRSIKKHNDNKVITDVAKILKEIKGNDEQSKLENFRRQFCLQTTKFVKNFSKKVIFASMNFNMTLTLPLRWMSELIRGIKSGQDTDVKILSGQEIVGDRRAISFSIYLLIKSMKLYSSGAPWVAPLMAAPLIQANALKFCQNNSSLASDDEEFCKKLKNKIDNFLQIAMNARPLGAKLSQHKAQVNQIWEGEVDDRNLCSYLSVLRNNKSNSDKEKQTKEALIGNLNPELMSYPEFNKINSENFAASYKNIDAITTLKNVIISLSPNPEVVAEITNSERWEEYMETKKELSRQTKIYNKLYRSDNIEKCNKIKLKKNFSLSRYNELKLKLSTFDEESLIEQHQLVEELFKRQKKILNLSKTKLNWELIPYGSLNTIHEFLRSKDIGNVIIIAHSSSELKKIVDVNMNQFPSTFFSDISPTIMSLSFYTCHSKNILSTYDLENKFQKSLSLYPSRLVNFVKPNDILEDGETPLMGFNAYLKRLDNNLYLQLKENVLEMSFIAENEKTQTEQECKIEIKTATPKSGSLSLILNKKFIGNLNSFESKTIFAFNCSLLKGKNILLLQNSSLIEQLQTDEIPTEIRLNLNRIETTKWKDYFDEKGNYGGSKIEFSI